MAKKITLTKGEFVIVDDIDFEWLSQWKWHLKSHKNSNGYAVRTQHLENPTTTIHIKMHRAILGLTEKKFVIDHINGNGLDNRKVNLRITDNFGNSWNSRLRSDNTSGFRGVSWAKHLKKWRARIHIKRKEILLGLYDNKDEAALAYNIAAKKHYGTFAKLNDVTTGRG